MLYALRWLGSEPGSSRRQTYTNFINGSVESFVSSTSAVVVNQDEGEVNRRGKVFNVLNTEDRIE